MRALINRSMCCAVFSCDCAIRLSPRWHISLQEFRCQLLLRQGAISYR
uniref:Uncharacterized protein n=1 Tax=Myoviridae sp. ctiBE32 TaxID=2826685 RepID=A0A8S5N8D6_9CAUD|nr:MAG TPA: hypothetical protein [Myoviridae sp. ctiBE32]